jgi:hypothetical protein
MVNGKWKREANIDVLPFSICHFPLQGASFSTLLLGPAPVGEAKLEIVAAFRAVFQAATLSQVADE